MQRELISQIQKAPCSGCLCCLHFPQHLEIGTVRVGRKGVWINQFLIKNHLKPKFLDSPLRLYIYMKLTILV